MTSGPRAARSAASTTAEGVGTQGRGDRRGRESISEIVAAIRSGETAAAAVAHERIQRATAAAALNAFRWIADPGPTSSPSDAADDSRLLAGVPIALKDNIDTAGIPTTSGSMVDIDRIPSADAPVWTRLRDAAGAFLVGKTHLAEFAYRAHHPDLGPVHNPRELSRATGGSSSGSAAAVAAGIIPVAIGTDTGGSTRIPAAYCGVVGFKGTLGLIETAGIVPLSTTMDHVGLLARSVADAAAAFDAMLPRPLGLVDPVTLALTADLPRPLRVGIDAGYLGADGAQHGVARAWRRAARLLEDAGATLIEVRLPDARRWRAAHKVIITTEAWDFHRPRLEAGAPYGPVFRTAITAAGTIPAHVRERAYTTRRSAMDAMGDAFSEVDVILTPTTPTVAPPLDEGIRGTAYTRYTTLAAFTGLPAAAVPAGTGYRGLPVGVQLIGRAHGDTAVLAVAAMLERLLAENSPNA